MTDGQTNTMMDDTPAAEPDRAGSQRDLQRSALSDLVALVTECARREKQMADESVEAAAQLDAQTHKSQRQLEDRVNQLRQSIEQSHHERYEQVDREYRQRNTALGTTLDTTRKEQQASLTRTRERAKQEMSQAKWLAESVYDGTVAQLRAEAKETDEQLEQHRGAIEAMRNEGIELLLRYGQPMPPAPAAERDYHRLLPKQAFALLDQMRQQTDAQLQAIKALPLPKLFVGVRPYLVMLIVAGVVGGITLLATGMQPLNVKAIAIAIGIALVLVVCVGIAVKMLAGKRVRALSLEFADAVDSAFAIADAYEMIATEDRQDRLNHADRSRERELGVARKRLEPIVAKANAQYESMAAQSDAQHEAQLATVNARYAQERGAIDQSKQQQLDELAQRQSTEQEKLTQQHAQRLADINASRARQRQELERRWHEGLHAIQQEGAGFNGVDGAGWDQKWKPPTAFPAVVRFGQLQIDLQEWIERTQSNARLTLPMPERFAMPAYLAFPRQASLLIQTDRAGRSEAIQTLQMVMTRLLTSLPPGRARFTLIDPVSLGQNFAGFMHLADFDEALVGGRIWTDSEQIQKRLADLTEHMETVIQKYLRNEFATIDDYNAQAGELAEPYQFLVIADLPVNFDVESMRRLASIANSGARCGVYTLVHRDLRHAMPEGSHLDELQAHSINLVRKNDRFIWQDEVFGQFPLTLDSPPDEAALTRILQRVGEAAKDATRVEVPFENIAPKADQFWSRNSSRELAVPVGRMGATRLQEVRLGRGVAQHALVAGKTGSGKSTLLHAMITNLAMWYAPDQVEMYLIDFKKGVEFKTYATHELPHARAIAVESDREFGLSVLHRLDAEMARRGELFRAAGVQEIGAYRQTKGALPMPRTLLIIDEYQEFFTEDDKLAQDASLLLDRLVRQGRAFGMHVFLGSQTIGGAGGLSRSTMGQMAVRIALQCSEADSQLILGDTNNAARLLSRPGEAIYNDAGGLVEGNSPFQVAWLPDERRDQFLERVNEKVAATGAARDWPAPVVFEGNAPAAIVKNAAWMAMLEDPWKRQPGKPPMAFVGDPVAIKDPTAVTFRRQSGANALIVGQQEESAMAMVGSMMLSLAAQQSPAEARFVILDGTPADSSLAGRLATMAAALPHDTQVIEWRRTESAIDELAKELADRQQSDRQDAPSIYVIVYGLQRYRMLRKSEDNFSFSLTDDAEKKADPGKQFAELLRDGPPAGIHVVAWSDTAATLERTLDRAVLREFDHRILFQMSANDSSALIDSPAANKLGFYRAVAFSEEQGTLEKFRPYALPDAAMLGRMQRGLQKQ